MQKNLFLGFLVFTVTGLCSCAYAETVEVASLGSFSTANPPSSIRIKLLDILELTNTTIPAGSEMGGKLVDVVSPKRLKRNAKFSFKPEWYIDTNGSKHNLNETVKATYTTTLNKGQLAKKAVLGVGNHFVKGLSMGVAAVEGVVENEEGNRLKSGAKSVYDASPLSYSEKGKDIVINENEIFYLKFPNTKKDKTQK
ncbi:hypothetical protein J6O86_06430 [bacterium]|nr:hypothetical protein [bacterium]